MIRKELCPDLSEEDAAMVVARYEAEFAGLCLSKVAGIINGIADQAEASRDD